jgi:hypothetical protein
MRNVRDGSHLEAAQWYESQNDINDDVEGGIMTILSEASLKSSINDVAVLEGESIIMSRQC